MQLGADGLQLHVLACHGTLHCVDKVWQQPADTHLSHSSMSRSCPCCAHITELLDAGVHVHVLFLVKRRA